MYKKKAEKSQKKKRENQFFIFNTTINNYNPTSHSITTPRLTGGQKAGEQNKSSSNASLKEDSSAPNESLSSFSKAERAYDSVGKAKPTAAKATAAKATVAKGNERFIQKLGGAEKLGGAGEDARKSEVKETSKELRMITQAEDRRETAAASNPAHVRRQSTEKRKSFSNTLQLRGLHRTASNSSALKTSRRVSDIYDTAKTSRNLRRLDSVNLKTHGSQQSKVKVVARVRPLSKMETSLMNTGVGSISTRVLDSSTIHFPTENQTYVFDTVLDTGSRQEEVYELVGKPMVSDIVDGFNGTILAYGQTGSGKTYTMFGTDIYDEEIQGIIPRAALEIFNAWDTREEVKEVELRCSMLEIYKEELRDLLSDEPADLKIKESPSRGIYVEGLKEASIETPDELMMYLDIGEARRVWAETRMNVVSSRSHTIFVLEVRQTLNNESEKRGILNLVDLAGSEKVGRFGAQGKIFEEGTKINLSLSILGNVIHSLTSRGDHVPYRESKLTRLLQESLGGNYKTTLVVTCSPHSTQLSETLSTMKFAQRAKKLKNKVKMNIKNSPDQLLKIIEHLKMELEAANLEIKRLKSGVPRAIKQKPSNLALAQVSKRASNDALLSPSLKQRQKELYETIEEETEDRKGTSTRTGGVNSDSCDVSEFRSKELEQENLRLRLQNAELQRQVELLKIDKTELEEKAIRSDLALIEQKKKVVELERMVADAELKLREANYYKDKANSKERNDSIQVKILESQIKALTEALEDAEGECFKLLKERKDHNDKERLELCSLSLVEYVSKESIHKSFTEKWVQDIESVELAMQGSFLGPKKLFTNKVELKLGESQLLSACKYAEVLGNALTEGVISSETLNYLLRNQVIEAEIMNHNLKRVISFLLWKLQVERSTASIKGEMGAILQKSVDSLEDLLTKASKNHMSWTKKAEQLDYDIEQLNQHVEARRGTSFSGIRKTKIRRPISKANLLRQLASAKATGKERSIGLLQQIRMLGPARKISCQTFSFGRLVDDMARRNQAALEDSGEPLVEEMDEEEEKQLDCAINQRYGMVTPAAENREVTPGRTGGMKSKQLVSEVVRASFRQEQIERMETNFQEAQIELAWHKTLAELLMEEICKTRRQVETLRSQVTEIKESSEQALQDENRNWQMITSSLKENYDKELARKEKELASINELLAQWIMKYIELEKAKGPVSESSIKALLKDISIQCSTTIGIVQKKSIGQQ